MSKEWSLSLIISTLFLSNSLSLSQSHQLLHVRGPGALALDEGEDALLRLRHRECGEEARKKSADGDREGKKETKNEKSERWTTERR